MTFSLIPTAAVLALSLNAQVPGPSVDVFDTSPGQVRIYVEEVECITIWRGRQKRTYCRVLRRGRPPRAPRVPPPAPNPPAVVPPAAPVAPLPPAPRTPRRALAPSFLTSDEAQVMSLLNAMRRKLGLRTLTLDKKATRVARAHSRDMCRRGYFAHKNLQGQMPWHRLKAGGVKFRGAGENIAAGQRTPLEVHRDWNNSPGHRKNRLGKRYRRMGIGVHWCNGVPHWTEVFMH